MSVVVGWDPQREPQWLPQFRAAAASIEAEGSGFTPWPTAPQTALTNGTLVHLLLQGEDRGIVATGLVCTAPFLSFTGVPEVGPLATHVMIAWLALLPTDERIAVPELQVRVPGVSWERTVVAELALDAESAQRLERVWLAPHPSAAPGPTRFTVARHLGADRRFAVAAGPQARLSRSAAAL
jgi:hypothetical protein